MAVQQGEERGAFVMEYLVREGRANPASCHHLLPCAAQRLTCATVWRVVGQFGRGHVGEGRLQTLSRRERACGTVGRRMQYGNGPDIQSAVEPRSYQHIRDIEFFARRCRNAVECLVSPAGDSVCLEGPIECLLGMDGAGPEGVTRDGEPRLILGQPQLSDGHFNHCHSGLLFRGVLPAARKGRKPYLHPECREPGRVIADRHEVAAGELQRSVLGGMAFAQCRADRCQLLWK